MKAKVLKKIITNAAPLLKKTILDYEDNLFLGDGYIGVKTFSIEASWKCENKTVGSIDFKDIQKTVKVLDANDDVAFSGDGNKIHILVNGKQIGSYKNTMDPKDEPKKLVGSKKSYVGEMDPVDYESIDTALEFVSKDELRPAMMCVLLGKKVVSTDGHLLYFKELQHPFGKVSVTTLENISWKEVKPEEKVDVKGMKMRYYTEKKELLIPSQYIKFLLSMSNLGYEVQAGHKVNTDHEEFPQTDAVFLHFENSKCVINLQMPLERFPDYNNVIPLGGDKNETNVTLPKKVFAKNIKMALTFANPITNKIMLTANVESEKVQLTAEDEDYDKKFSVELDCSVKQKQFEEKDNFDNAIAFNGNNLLRAINKTENESFSLRFWQSNRAAVIDGMFLVMPVALLKESYY